MISVSSAGLSWWTWMTYLTPNSSRRESLESCTACSDALCSSSCRCGQRWTYMWRRAPGAPEKRRPYPARLHGPGHHPEIGPRPGQQDQLSGVFVGTFIWAGSWRRDALYFVSRSQTSRCAFARPVTACTANLKHSLQNTQHALARGMWMWGFVFPIFSFGCVHRAFILRFWYRSQSLFTFPLMLQRFSVVVQGRPMISCGVRTAITKNRLIYAVQDALKRAGARFGLSWRSRATARLADPYGWSGDNLGFGDIFFCV